MNNPSCVVLHIFDYLNTFSISGITNGAAWYNVAGGMQDYNYLHGDTFEITVEMDCCKFPHHSKLTEQWNNHKRSLIDYIKLTHLGLKGQVK